MVVTTSICCILSAIDSSECCVDGAARISLLSKEMQKLRHGPTYLKVRPIEIRSVCHVTKNDEELPCRVTFFVCCSQFIQTAQNGSHRVMLRYFNENQKNAYLIFYLVIYEKLKLFSQSMDIFLSVIQICVFLATRVPC